ncbi:MAG: hypothetical protein ABL957_03110 [Parvularculaceae bacterium]
MPIGHDTQLQQARDEESLDASGSEIAEYVKDMVGQLERLAAGRDFERLRDLLRLARDEAHRRAGH